MPPPKRAYQKPALSPPDLLRHLESRGLQVTDRVEALRTLEYVDYYRLLGYMRPFQDGGEHGVRRFRTGTMLQDVLALYEFDRKLRLLSLDAAERIEVALRAAIVSQVAVPHGSHFYTDSRFFESPKGWQDFIAAVREERHRSMVLRHYFETYDSPVMPPIWSAMEAVSFGALSHLYSNLNSDLRKGIARRFGYDELVLKSWFRSITTLRNIAAHHSRLWNANISVDKPMKAKKVREEFGKSMSTFFARAVVMVALFDAIGRDVGWKIRLRSLVDAHPFVPETWMGFPAGWRDRSFWNPSPAVVTGATPGP